MFKPNSAKEPVWGPYCSGGASSAGSSCSSLTSACSDLGVRSPSVLSFFWVGVRLHQVVDPSQALSLEAGSVPCLGYDHNLRRVGHL